MTDLKRGMPAIHPGIIIKEEYLPGYDLTQEQLAKLMGLSRPVMNNILNGHARLTAGTAVRLAEVFNTSAQYWLNMQSSYDIDQAREDHSQALALLHKVFGTEKKRRIVDDVEKQGKRVFVNEVVANQERRTDPKMRRLVDNLAKIDGRKNGANKKKD